VSVIAGSVVAATPASAQEQSSTMYISTVATTEQPAGEVHDVAMKKALAASVARGTTSSLQASKSTIQSGRSVKLTGKVTYGKGNAVVRTQAVTLESKSGTGWKTVASRSLSDDGVVTFTVKPSRSTTYRLTYAGAAPLAASVSPEQTVSVTAPPPPSPTGSSSSSRSSTSSSGWSSAAGTATGAKIVAAAAAHSGTPYSYGAGGPNAFDCSGLTQYVFRQFGVSLPHNAHAQLSYGRTVSKADALPGDLVFFLDGGHAYHVGIYAGGGYMIDAPRSGSTVGKHAIWSSNVVFRRMI
jgi:cell wall-associated NlpC family hydrolase